jgi:hypothetical protein
MRAKAEGLYSPDFPRCRPPPLPHPTMSTLPPSITDLAETIKSNTKIVAEHLQNNSLPPLSLSADTYPFFPGTGPGAVDHFPSPSQEIIKARNDARQAYETLLQLLDTPADNLFYYMCQHFNSA